VSDYEIITRLKKELEEGKRVVLVTLTYKEGSGPRDPGSKILINSEGETLGTIGGGEMERILVEEAMEALTRDESRSLKFAMGVQARGDMIELDSKCGGEVEVFLDVVKPTSRLIILGSGLIAQAVARYAAECGFHVTVVDDADTANPELFPSAEVVNDSYPGSLRKLEVRPSDYLLMLHGETDFELEGLRYAVREEPSFIGLLGSSNKAKEHKKQLKEEGFPPEAVDSIVGPVGLDIRAETPNEIAISIVAQLIEVRHA